MIGVGEGNSVQDAIHVVGELGTALSSYINNFMEKRWFPERERACAASGGGKREKTLEP